MDSTFKFNRDTLHVVMYNAKEPGHHTNYWPWVIGTVVVILFILIFHRSVKQAISRVKPKSYKLNLSVFSIEGDLNYTTIGQEVAWKIYIELITRISGNELHDQTGIFREALNSLYTAFGSLRDTLKNADVALAKEPARTKEFTVAALLLIIMNDHLRPFLSKWHPLLQEHEQKKTADVSQYAHEKAWERNEEFRTELKKLKTGLSEYVAALKNIAEGKTKP